MTDTAQTPRDSLTQMTQIVLPQHTNAVETGFGGTVMSWIDVCAAVTAQRHCRAVAVTASVDDLHFRAPLRLGDVVVLEARVNAVFKTSLEVRVMVEREEPQSGERVRCVNARLTFVCLDRDGRPKAVPPLRLETDEDRSIEEDAIERRAERLERRRRRRNEG